jgi:NAD(P)-dependent dehydrogenase (short-subunit alcohol dehydrogenase family)
MNSFNFDDKIVFVSGANRGIGKALVDALLKSKVKKIYAAARHEKNLPDFGDVRVVKIILDITDAEQVRKAAAQAADTQVLINNAGALTFSPITTGKPEDIKFDMQVNYFGTVTMVQTFAPLLEKNGGGVIANISSIVGLAPMADIGSYSASKAALASATQAMRAELKAKNISVHGIFPGPIDTDMAKDFDMPKNSAANTAENILAGIQSGQEDIFPDPMSAQLGKLWAEDPKGLERQFAAM